MLILVLLDALNFGLLEKGLRLVSPPHFLHDISHVIFYYLTKFHCLITFTSCDIGQYVHCSY